MAGGFVPESGPTQDEKTQAMLVWILAIFIGFISPLIFYLISKEKKFVFWHAAQCLTFNLIGLIFAVVTCGIGGLVVLVFNVIAAIKANEGVWYEPPVTSNLARNWFKV
ncbi:MAG TPA: DUF4870 domain-containing protein [Fimbriimonadaceae bacterium]|nr:DUF4870 domain-containing protein [Fimbriimonadaceae bacterium]HRJ33225.1 DUF4870 domain-containing protein [Fimbriimonadaceae bacterium]